MSKQFEVKCHSYQIADTGDYDGYWEITNGEISLQTNDDGDDMDKILGTIATALNDSECKFHLDNSKEIDLHCECEGLKIQLKEQESKYLEREKVLVDALKEVMRLRDLWQYCNGVPLGHENEVIALKNMEEKVKSALTNYAGEQGKEVGNE